MVRSFALIESSAARLQRSSAVAQWNQAWTLREGARIERGMAAIARQVAPLAARRA